MQRKDTRSSCCMRNRKRERERWVKREKEKRERLNSSRFVHIQGMQRRKRENKKKKKNISPQGSKLHLVNWRIIGPVTFFLLSFSLSPSSTSPQFTHCTRWVEIISLFPLNTLCVWVWATIDHSLHCWLMISWFYYFSVSSLLLLALDHMSGRLLPLSLYITVLHREWLAACEGVRKTNPQSVSEKERESVCAARYVINMESLKSVFEQGKREKKAKVKIFVRLHFYCWCCCRYRLQMLNEVTPFVHLFFSPCQYDFSFIHFSFLVFFCFTFHSHQGP